MNGVRALPLYDVFLLADARDLSAGLSRDDKFVLVDQLLVLLESFYSHLPLKESMLAARPIQEARLIQAALDFFPDDVTFLHELIDLFISLRDLHTNLVLPAPWQGLRAFLPFIIEEYYDETQTPRYIVTKVSPFADLGDDFVPGVEITHWNGVPMINEVRRQGRATDGANPAARRRRALYFLTTRSLAFQLPPQADWVTLTYVGAKGLAEIKYPWLASFAPPEPEAPDTVHADAPYAMAIGVDELSLQVQRLRKRVLVPGRLEEEGRILGLRMLAAQGAESMPRGLLEQSSAFAKNLSFGTINTPSGEFGHLRIWNFEVTDVDGFVKEVRRIVEMLPQQGLILDVRGNPGGTIPAGERILQFFTPKRIDPQPLQFRITEFNRAMANGFAELEPWRSSLNLGVITGEVFSQGFPLTSPDEANDTGQIYHGPVVAVIDAMCYSTCDFFIGGFQDQQIGPIVGIDDRTGAGGANVWTHDLLLQIFQNFPGKPLKPLPGGASMRVAVRRSTRVRNLLGIPVEGLGVQADHVRRPTRDDLLNDNVDLFNFVGQLLRDAGRRPAAVAVPKPKGPEPKATAAKAPSRRAAPKRRSTRRTTAKTGKK